METVQRAGGRSAATGACEQGLVSFIELDPTLCRKLTRRRVSHMRVVICQLRSVGLKPAHQQRHEEAQDPEARDSRVALDKARRDTTDEGDGVRHLAVVERDNLPSVRLSASASPASPGAKSASLSEVCHVLFVFRRVQQGSLFFSAVGEGGARGVPAATTQGGRGDRGGGAGGRVSSRGATTRNKVEVARLPPPPPNRTTKHSLEVTAAFSLVEHPKQKG